MARCSARAIALLVLALLLASGAERAAAQETCGADLMGLLSECEQYVRKSGPKVAPSKACCKYVVPIDMACGCKYVTKDIEDMVSMDKVVYVAQSCGKKIPRGFVCGSYKVPKA